MSLPDPQIAEAAAARLLAGLNTRADEWAERIGLGRTVARLMLSPRRVARVVELIKTAYCEGAYVFGRAVQSSPGRRVVPSMAPVVHRGLAAASSRATCVASSASTTP